LAEALAGFAAGAVTPEALTETFRKETVYCQAAEQPGFLAVGPPGAGLVPVFSSLDQLSRYAVAYGLRGGIDWLSTTGADVLDLLPNGYGIVVDPAGDHAVTLPAHALHRAVVMQRVEVGE
jgi:hypothetical protein